MKDGKLRELEARIDQLESRPTDFVDAVRRKLASAHGLEISRRDVVVGLTSAGISGAALLALTPGQAAAAVVGNIGTNADPLDTVFTQNVDPGTSGSVVNIPGISTGSIGNDGSPISVTDELDRDVSKGSTTKLIQGAEDTDNGGGQVLTQPTDDVSTSAKTIITFGNELRQALILVEGDEQAATNRFFEIVQFAGSETPSALHTLTTNTPDGRTYSRSASSVQLAMAANTYDVTATALYVRRDFNATS